MSGSVGCTKDDELLHQDGISDVTSTSTKFVLQYLRYALVAAEKRSFRQVMWSPDCYRSELESRGVSRG